MNKGKKEIATAASQSSLEYKMYSITAVQHYKFLNRVIEQAEELTCLNMENSIWMRFVMWNDLRQPDHVLQLT